jgi:hypothetical protein
MKLTKLIIHAFAVYRAARLVTREDGPYHVFLNIRRNIIEKASWGDEAQRHHWQEVSDLFECPYCIGIWIALIIGFFPDWFINLLAIAGIQVVVQDISDFLNTNEGALQE